MSRSHLVVLAALLAGCGVHASQPTSPAAPDGAVALIVEGSAFPSDQARAALARRLEAVARRPVVLLPTPPSPADPGVVAAVKAAVAADPSLARRDWRTEPCARESALLAALGHPVDVVYRVAVGVGERERPLTPAEAAKPAIGTAILGLVGLAKRGTAREETVSGEVDLWTFVRRKEAERVQVERTVARLEPTPFTTRLDPLDVVAGALETLPSPPPPAWEAVARRLIASRCPVLALAVAETRIGDRGVRRHLRATVVGRPRARNERASASREEPKPSPAPGAETPTADQQPAPPPPDERYSCRSLCRMHMIELCNRDKALWDAHGRRWDMTPCGSMRDYGFLQDCYRRQWLSGAYQESCVNPCEGASEGRERLLRILQEAGCLRPRRS